MSENVDGGGGQPEPGKRGAPAAQERRVHRRLDRDPGDQDTPTLAKLLARRRAIEPEIGHMKTDRRLARCPDILPAEVVRHAPIRALRESPAARAALGILERRGWLAPLDPGTVVRGALRKEAWAIVRRGGA